MLFFSNLLSSVQSRNFKAKLCQEASAQKLHDCAAKINEMSGNIRTYIDISQLFLTQLDSTVINLFITSQLPSPLFVRVYDMCHRMGYDHNYIDAHYIFSAFREALKGKARVMEEGK